VRHHGVHPSGETVAVRVVVLETATMKLVRHSAIFVTGEPLDHGLDTGDERLLHVGPVL